MCGGRTGLGRCLKGVALGVDRGHRDNGDNGEYGTDQYGHEDSSSRRHICVGVRIAAGDAGIYRVSYCPENGYADGASNRTGEEISTRDYAALIPFDA